MAKKFMKEGVDSKLKFSLIAPEAKEELAKVLTFGARKYEAHNWKKCKDLSLYWDAMYRHLNKYESGEAIDPETGISHLSHAFTNLMFLIYFERRQIDRAATTSKDN